METEAPCPQFRSVHKAYLTCAAPCVKLHAVFAPLKLKSNNQLGIVYKFTRSQCAHGLGESSKGQETRTLVPEELQVQPQQMQPERILRPTSSHILPHVGSCMKLLFARNFGSKHLLPNFKLISII